MSVLSLVFSPLLFIYSVGSFVLWLCSDSYYNSSTSTLVICISLFCMAIVTLTIFITTLTNLIHGNDNDCNLNCRRNCKVPMAICLAVCALLYCGGMISANPNKMYCDDDLCKMQMIQLMTLPMIITITLCIEQFADENFGESAGKRIVIRVCIYVLVILIEVGFNIYSQCYFSFVINYPYLRMVNIMCVILLTIFFGCLLYSFWHIYDSKWKVVQTIGILSAISVTIMAILNIYTYWFYIKYDIHNIKWLYHYCLVIATAWFIFIDIASPVFFVYKEIPDPNYYQQPANNIQNKNVKLDLIKALNEGEDEDEDEDEDD
eukprot:198721_1